MRRLSVIVQRFADAVEFERAGEFVGFDGDGMPLYGPRRPWLVAAGVVAAAWVRNWAVKRITKPAGMFWDEVRVERAGGILDDGVRGKHKPTAVAVAVVAAAWLRD